MYYDSWNLKVGYFISVLISPNYFFSGPMMALALAREDAVTAWRGMLGPKEIDKAKEEAPER